MSQYDLPPGICENCPDETRIKGGNCIRDKAQWICPTHFKIYATNHASCKSCWGRVIHLA